MEKKKRIKRLLAAGFLAVALLVFGIEAYRYRNCGLVVSVTGHNPILGVGPGGVWQFGFDDIDVEFSPGF